MTVSRQHKIRQGEQQCFIATSLHIMGHYKSGAFDEHSNVGLFNGWAFMKVFLLYRLSVLFILQIKCTSFKWLHCCNHIVHTPAVNYTAAIMYCTCRQWTTRGQVDDAQWWSPQSLCCVNDQTSLCERETLMQPTLLCFMLVIMQMISEENPAMWHSNTTINRVTWVSSTSTLLLQRKQPSWASAWTSFPSWSLLLLSDGIKWITPFTLHSWRINFLIDEHLSNMVHLFIKRY